MRILAHRNNVDCCMVWAHTWQGNLPHH